MTSVFVWAYEIAGLVGEARAQEEESRTNAMSQPHNAKLWDHSTLDPAALLVEVGRIGDLNKRQISDIYERFNRYGVAIVQHAPVDKPVEELVDLGKLFGKPVVHDRADERGLVEVAELSGYGEFVGASSGPHLMHTGGTFMSWDDVPKIVLLQCETQSRIGGRSLVASGANAYHYLRKNDPDALKLLMDPQVFSIRRSAHGVGKFGGTGVDGKPVFDTGRLGNGKVWLTFRFDGQVKLEIKPDTAVPVFDRLLDFFNRSENQIDFKLQPNQILVCDNTSVVHARTAFQSGSNRKLNRLQLDGTYGDVEFGFPA
jgi:alpha-ketoglutarate-dependent taurine dioxygenase